MHHRIKKYAIKNSLGNSFIFFSELMKDGVRTDECIDQQRETVNAQLSLNCRP